MNNIIDLEYLDNGIVAHFLDGNFKLYIYDFEEELLANMYVPDELTVVKRIRSKETRKEVDDMINFYFNHDTLDIDYKVKTKKITNNKRSK